MVQNNRPEITRDDCTEPIYLLEHCAETRMATLQCVDSDSPLSRFPCEYSITASSYSPNGHYLITGSRGGEIFLWNIECLHSKDLKNPTRLYHRPGVASLAYLDNQQFLSFAFDHTCRIWDQTNLQILEEFWLEHEICSICPLDQNRIAFLTMQHQLIQFDLQTKSVIAQCTLPLLPQPFNLLELTYWSDWKLLAIPLANGEISVYDLQWNELARIHFHEGKFFALSRSGNELFTGGWNDHTICWWDLSTKEHISSFRVMDRIAQVACFGDTERHLVCVLHSGSVVLFTLSDHGIQQQSDFSHVNSCYLTQPHHALRSFLKQRDKQQQAKEWSSAVQNHLKQNNDEQALEGIHQIKQLGYLQTALSLQVIYAQQQQQPLSILQALWELYQTLHSDHPDFQPYFRSLIRSLHRFLLREKAQQLQEAHGWIEDNAASASTDRKLFGHTQISLDHHLEAAELVDGKIQHCHILETLQSVVYPSIHFNPKCFCEIYQQSSPPDPFPPVQWQEIDWQEDETLTTTTSLFCISQHHEPLPGLGLGLRIIPTATQHRIIPFSFVDLQCYSQETVSNLSALPCLIHQQKQAIDAWFNQLSHIFQQCIRKTLNHSMAQGGTKHAQTK